MQSLALLLYLSECLVGDGGFSVEAPPPTIYKYEVQLGTLPDFHKHEEPVKEENLGPLKKIPKKESPKNRILVYSKVPLTRLKKGSTECPPCLATYVASQNVPEIVEDFEFEFTTKFPDWAEKLGQEPILHWQTCPNGKSKGIWMRQIGWTTPEAFLANWDIAEGKKESLETKPPKLVQKKAGPHENNPYIPRMPVSQFSWPGGTASSLKHHLETTHRINTNGMSYSEMLYEHNKWHTIHGPR